MFFRVISSFFKCCDDHWPNCETTSKCTKRHYPTVKPHTIVIGWFFNILLITFIILTKNKSSIGSFLILTEKCKHGVFKRCCHCFFIFKLDFCKQKAASEYPKFIFTNISKQSMFSSGVSGFLFNDDPNILLLCSMI